MSLQRVAGLIFVLFIGLSSYGANDSVLHCEATDEDGKVISYTMSESDNVLTLKKRVGEEEIAEVALTTPAQAVKGYGGTTLLFKDSGKSGYLFLYFHRASESDLIQKDTALIDINLFQPSVRKLNTEGPRTDFICSSSRR